MRRLIGQAAAVALIAAAATVSVWLAAIALGRAEQTRGKPVRLYLPDVVYEPGRAESLWGRWNISQSVSTLGLLRIGSHITHADALQDYPGLINLPMPDRPVGRGKFQIIGTPYGPVALKAWEGTLVGLSAGTKVYAIDAALVTGGGGPPPELQRLIDVISRKGQPVFVQLGPVEEMPAVRERLGPLTQSAPLIFGSLFAAKGEVGGMMSVMKQSGISRYELITASPDAAKEASRRFRRGETLRYVGPEITGGGPAMRRYPDLGSLADELTVEPN